MFTRRICCAFHDCGSVMTCTKCNADKAEGEFHFRNKALGTRRSRCKTCMSDYNTSYYVSSLTRAERVKLRRRTQRWTSKQFVQQYLTTHPCIDCSESDPVCLDFDHVRGKKFHEISLLVREGYSLVAIIAEIKKCKVRCANCHRKITARRRKMAQGYVDTLIET